MLDVAHRFFSPDSTPIFSVVSPAFNEAVGLPAFHARLRAVMDSLGSWEAIYIDDGSTDDTRAVVERLRQDDPRIAVLSLSRNFGKEIATTAGLDHATGDATIVIDADLQDPPEVIPLLVAAWRQGFDMVNAQRRVRAGETRLKRATAHLFYKVMRHAIVGLWGRSCDQDPDSWQRSRGLPEPHDRHSVPRRRATDDAGRDRRVFGAGVQRNKTPAIVSRRSFRAEPGAQRCCGMIRLLCLLAILAVPTWAQPPAERLARLRHGVNITGWFRYPGSRDPAYLVRWMSDSAMEDLRRAGFGFVRLAIDPPVADAPGMRDIVVDAVCRLQRHGLAVVVDAHPTDWHLETSVADRVGLRTFWRAMAPALRRCDPALTIPEVLNEPVFPGDPGGWAALQHAVLGDIRAGLPDSTVVLTGNGWGSIGGLLALRPEADPNTIYSFHFYDPAELTSLASYRPGLDRQALARLPFPVGDRAACEATAAPR